MTGTKTYQLSRGVFGVTHDGREIGTVRHNVVTSGAIKWSAYDQLDQRLQGTYLTMSDAVKAVADAR
jgi:hypothetical protein